jgi:hypothetical protein
MLGRKLLMVLPERQGLRGLDETPRALCIFFQVHGGKLPYGPARQTRSDRPPSAIPRDHAALKRM